MGVSTLYFPGSRLALAFAVTAVGCIYTGGDPGDSCNDSCRFAFDGECDDGGEGSITSLCSYGSDCGDCGPRDEPDVPPEPTLGACIGTARDPSDYGDQNSCDLSAGIWDGLDHDCESGYADDCDDVHVYTASDVPLARQQCIDRIGCQWQSPNGNREEHPLIGGRCEGVTPACNTLYERESCIMQGFQCAWEDPSPVRPGGCEDANGYIALYNVRTCEGVSAAAEWGSAHWSTAHYLCLEMLGCRWIHADGLVEEGPKSDWVP
jgi:hypothetical protein